MYAQLRYEISKVPRDDNGRRVFSIPLKKKVVEFYLQQFNIGVYQSQFLKDIGLPLSNRKVHLSGARILLYLWLRLYAVNGYDSIHFCNSVRKILITATPVASPTYSSNPAQLSLF